MIIDHKSRYLLCTSKKRDFVKVVFNDLSEVYGLGSYQMYAGINIMNSSRKQKEMIEVKCPAVGLVYCFLTVCIDQ